MKHLVFNLSADVLAKDHSRGSGVSAAATMGHAGERQANGMLASFARHWKRAQRGSRSSWA